jgi:hypothetical protein
MKNLLNSLKTILLALWLIFPQNADSQVGIKKMQIVTAYNTIKLTAKYPKTWNLIDYKLYLKERDRKCIDLAYIEVDSKNYYGTTITNVFAIYFINGEMFYYMEVPYDLNFINLYTPETANNVIELAVETAVEVNRTISRQELCNSQKETIEAERRLLQEKKDAENKKIALEAAEKLKKEKEIQDLSTTQNINSYILNGSVEKAAQEYSKLHFQNNDLKKQIQNLLNDFFADSKTNVTEKNLDIILNKNRDEFSKLGSGKYSLIIEKNGNVMLDKKTLGSTYSGLESTYNEMHGFKCLSSQSTEIIIEIKEKKIFENDSVKYCVSEKNKGKDIYLSKKGAYFLGWFAAPLNAEKITKHRKYCFNKNQEGNNIDFLQLYLSTKTLNGKLIDEKRIYKTEKIITPKKAIGRKIFRIITSPLWIFFVDFNSI